MAAQAGHLPGGNITYTCQGGNVYTVTLTLFRDCQGAPMISQALSFASDCGTTFVVNALAPGPGTEVSQLCPADLPNSSCNGGPLPGIEVYRYETTLGLAPCDGWTITWSECCRNSSLNVSGNPGMTIEARLNSATAPCNNSPTFTQDVIPYVCVGQPVTYNLGVTEPDGHALRYRLTEARNELGQPVAYLPGYSGQEPFAGMALDSLTGQLTFTPTLLGNIITAVRVDEYDQNGDLAGSVMRDFLFVVVACPNAPPDPAHGQPTLAQGDVVAIDTTAISVCPGAGFCADLTYSDPDAGQTLLLTSNVDAVVPGAQLTSTGSNPLAAVLCVPSAPLAEGTYGFVVTAADDGCPNTALTTYSYTLNVLPDTAAACLSTGIGAIKAPAALIFPSPARDRITVITPDEVQAPLLLIDAQGRLAITARTNGLRTVLDIQALAPGSYTVRTANGPPTVLGGFIKED
jgi:hypothetical protein